MKKHMDYIGVLTLVIIFSLFYFITSLVLDKLKRDEQLEDNNIAIEEIDPSYKDEKNIVNNLYQDVRILYDVVNSKFKVSQEDIIVINDITYKKITNFDDVIGNLFTTNGLNKYISDLGSFFAITEDSYYLAGNLVSYQTYYFRGDTTNIYILDATDTEINAIIYEKWSSNNKNTLAKIKVINENNKWYIDNISILANE